MMLVERLLRLGSHTVRCVVVDHAEGWEVREERDSVVLRDAIRGDWHRVERDLLLFDGRAAVLRQQGWNDEARLT